MLNHHQNIFSFSVGNTPAVDGLGERNKKINQTQLLGGVAQIDTEMQKEIEALYGQPAGQSEKEIEEKLQAIVTRYQQVYQEAAVS